MPSSGFSICQLPGHHDTGLVLHTAEGHRLIWVCGQRCVTVYGILATSFLTIHSQRTTSGLISFFFNVLIFLVDSMKSTPVDIISGEKIKYETKLPRTCSDGG